MKPVSEPNMSKQDDNKYLVTSKSMRPASDKRQCFYCQRLIGEFHKSDCVLIIKKVLVRMTVDYEIEVPAHWDVDLIELSRNEGSWCSNNAIAELEALTKDDCLCDRMTYEYIKDTSSSYLSES